MISTEKYGKNGKILSVLNYHHHYYETIQHLNPENVTPEVLSAMVTNHQREQDCYWRSSLMITVGSGEFGDFRSWRHKLYCTGLHFLYHESVSHYVTGRGNLRLTYRSEYEMRMKIIQARKFCKDKNLRNVHIEFMVPPRFVQEKKEMMKKGRQMKANGLIGVYDVLIKWGQPVLRTFSQTQHPGSSIFKSKSDSRRKCNT